MMEVTNSIKLELSRDHVVCGCMVTEMRTPAVGMILERAGLDFFILDMEHGSFTYETAGDILVACHGLRIIPFVRVPGINREPFQKLLDAGARGLLLPRVDDPGQVREALDLLRYPPLGSRGLSLRRAHTGFDRPDPAEFTAQANREIMLLAQIETRTGVENLESIVDVGGIDVLFVGPSDLARSYNGDSGEIERAIRRIIHVGRVKGIATGIHHSNEDYLSTLISQGMRFVSLNTEVGVIVRTFREMRSAVKSASVSKMEDR